jgi:signal transduction histidine kinase/CheY-like chemotaxis protein
MDQSKTKWTLGNKIIVLFLVLGGGFSIGGYLALRVFVLPVFAEFERESSEDTLARVEQAMTADVRELTVVNIEYSFWDETYSFAQGRNSDYADENFDPNYWHSINIDLVLVFDAHGNKLFGRLGHPTDGRNLPLEDELLQPLIPTHPLVSHESTDHSYKGILQTRSGSLHVASFPILRTDETGPIAGSFVTGRFLTVDLANEFGKRATAAVSIHPTSYEGSRSGTATAIQILLDSDEALYSEITDTSIIQYRLLRDVFNDPAVVLEVSKPRRITQIGSATVRTSTMFLVAASAVFLLSGWIFLQRLIVTPVQRLKEQMLGIRHGGDLNIVVDTSRSDEVGLLAGEFSELTLKLGQAQQELEKARDDAIAMSNTKSEFLARMSHEIRTPMNGVLGMTELLQDTQLGPKQQRFAQTIRESAESLLDIINDILDFSRMEAGKLRLELIDVDLRNILEETIDSLANVAYGKNIELINIVPPDLHTTVHADPGRLRQVLTNLVGNAIKFTEEGEVVLSVSTTEIDAENVKVLFEIKDTGIGIKPDKQTVIFDSFAQEDGSTTRLYGGTGLGLAISKQLVDLMGGDLTLESTPGKGSTFSFSLLMKKGSASDYRPSTHPGILAGAKILIVDDNATNREILGHQLTTWRAYTDSAASASDALSILESAVAAGDAHDLAILDMHMPHKDGMALAGEIRDNSDFADVKLIILSSVATPLSDDALADLNIAGQLTKPIRQSQLYDSLMVVLRGETVAQSHSNLKIASIKALSGCVLLAEDNLVNQAVAVGMLEAMGLSVIVSANGQDAIQKVSSEPIDAILMDCQMPGMDGFQATKTIRRMQRESGTAPTPIIAVTANALKGDRELCLAAGMDDYLTKPYTSEQLHSILTLFLQPDAAVQSADPEAQTGQQDPIGTLSESESPVDSSVFDELSKLQKPGAPNIVEKVIYLYLENSRELKDKLHDAVNNANAALVRESAHALKSSSANVGANGLADLCKHLEIMGRQDNLSDAPTIHERFEREYARVVAALKLEVASSTA